ncbi:hypothetical protein [Spongorhabdus nitratireducens]
MTRMKILPAMLVMAGMASTNILADYKYCEPAHKLPEDCDRFAMVAGSLSHNMGTAVFSVITDNTGHPDIHTMPFAIDTNTEERVQAAACEENTVMRNVDIHRVDDAYGGTATFLSSTEVSCE